MDKKKKVILSIIAVSILSNIFVVSLTFVGITRYLSIDQLLTTLPNSINKISNTKVIQEKKKEKRTIENLQNDVTDAIAKAGKSVVSIAITKDLKVYYEDPMDFFGGYITKKNKKVGGGSGIIISSDGYILTNKHVLKDPQANYTVITKNGQNYKVDKVWFDPKLDLAVLKVLDENGNQPTSLPTANFVDKDSNIKIGQFAVSIGNALSKFENTATFGIISGKGRKLKQNQNDSLYVGLYQTDAPINPGNSGGPLLNINGKILGVNTAISAVGQGIGFAIPINKQFVNATLDSIQNNGKIIRPFMGIVYTNLNSTLAKKKDLKKSQGLYIQKVVPNSPADKVGLQKGDIITSLQGQPIDTQTSFLYQLYTYNIKDTIQIQVFSNGGSKKLKLTLGQR